MVAKKLSLDQFTKNVDNLDKLNERKFVIIDKLRNDLQNSINRKIGKHPFICITNLPFKHNGTTSVIDIYGIGIDCNNKKLFASKEVISELYSFKTFDELKSIVEKYSVDSDELMKKYVYSPID